MKKVVETAVALVGGAIGGLAAVTAASAISDHFSEKKAIEDVSEDDVAGITDEDVQKATETIFKGTEF